MKKYYVITQKYSSDPDAEFPAWMKAGFIYAANRDAAADKVMAMHSLKEEDIDESEEGGWGGRPDNYLLLIFYKQGKPWGEINITDAPTWPVQVINDTTLKRTLEKPYPQNHKPVFSPVERR